MITESDILRAKVLIVDDLEANVLLLEQMLTGAGYTAVTSTMRPDQVCELHLLNRYDLILLDLQMPRMDGFAVMENLKTIETGYLPVLVITAQAGHKLRALKAGARDFISKPFDLAEVLIRVHNLLEVRLLHREAVELCDRILTERKVAARLLDDLLPPRLAPHPDPAADAAGPGANLLTGTRAEVAVLFMDIAAFAAFADGADAQVLTGVLNEIAGRQDDDGPAFVRARNFGNACLAAVGLPDAVADHTLACADKALDLIEAVDRFNRHSPYRLQLSLAVGAGPIGQKSLIDL